MADTIETHSFVNRSNSSGIHTTEKVLECMNLCQDEFDSWEKYDWKFKHTEGKELKLISISHSHYYQSPYIFTSMLIVYKVIY